MAFKMYSSFKKKGTNILIFDKIWKFRSTFIKRLRTHGVHRKNKVNIVHSVINLLSVNKIRYRIFKENLETYYFK